MDRLDLARMNMEYGSRNRYIVGVVYIGILKFIMIFILTLLYFLDKTPEYRHCHENILHRSVCQTSGHHSDRLEYGHNSSKGDF